MPHATEDKCIQLHNIRYFGVHWIKTTVRKGYCLVYWHKYKTTLIYMTKG